jgi:tetratricopeptide (TPR) repeat protein
MEQIAEQILDELSYTRGLVFVACIAIVIGVVFFVVNALSNIVLNWRMYSASRNGMDDFGHHADDLLKSNQLEQLLKVCEARLETHENDADANVFKAKALYYRGSYHEAKRSFARAIELEPSFDYILEPWLDSLESKLKDSAPRLV